MEWPGKGRGEGSSVPKGYVYVVLEGEGAVPALLSQVADYYPTSTRPPRLGTEVLLALMHVLIICSALLTTREVEASTSG